MSLLAKPIFGIIARTQYGRDNLTPEKIHPWVRSWLSFPTRDAWWINQENGIALFQPDFQFIEEDTGEESCLCIRGSVIADGIDDLQINTPRESSSNGLPVILAALLKHETSLIRKMRGQFTFAYWDGSKRSLSLVRDHLGQRNLFTRTETHYIIFCSELAPLLCSPDRENTLDEEGVFWYLAFGMPPPGKTLVKNINRIPAAHFFRWQLNAPLVQQRYWSPLTAEAPVDVTDEFIVRTRRALELSICRRLTDSQKQGIFLSGGIDSTFLAATAKMMGASSLNSFTAEFDEEYGINETTYAAEVSKWLDIPHHIVPLSIEQSFEQINEVLATAAEPCSAWAVLTHFQILAAAQQIGITSMISGLGADEIFGGYDHFRGYYSRYTRYKLHHKLPGSMHPFEALMMKESQSERRVLYPGVARFFDDKSLLKGLKAPYNKWHYASHLRDFYRECLNLKPEAGVMEMMVAHECQHRIPDLLFSCFEPLSRRMGIDVKYPFLDPDVIELVSGLSVTSRYRTSSGQFSLQLKKLMPRFKYAMLKVAEDRVPKYIRERPRKSYTAPFGQWLFQPEFFSHIYSRMNKSRFWERNIVDRKYLDHIVAKIVPGPNPYVFQVWILFTLIEWYNRFIDAPKKNTF